MSIRELEELIGVLGREAHLHLLAKEQLRSRKELRRSEAQIRQTLARFSGSDAHIEIREIVRTQEKKTTSTGVYHYCFGHTYWFTISVEVTVADEGILLGPISWEREKLRECGEETEDDCTQVSTQEPPENRRRVKREKPMSEKHRISFLKLIRRGGIDPDNFPG